LEYNAATQSVQLAFWKPFEPRNEQKHISPQLDRKSTPDCREDLTTVYDPETETVQLISLAAYWSENQKPQQDWAVEYDEASQSVKRVFWKPFSATAPPSTPSVQPCLAPAVLPEPVTTVPVRPPTLALTTVYNAEKESIDLVLYDEYVRCNKVPKQDYALVYDEASESVKLIFWKHYQESLNKAVEEKSLPPKVGCESDQEPPFAAPSLSPKGGVAAEGGYAAMYNEAEQSVELINWASYEADFLPDIIYQRNKLFPILSHQEAMNTIESIPF